MRKQYFAFGIIFLLSVQHVFAHRPYKKSELDSLKRLDIQHRKTQEEAIRKNIVYVHFSPVYADSLLAQMEQYHIALNSITNQTRYSFKTKQIQRDLQNIQTTIDIITQNVSRDSGIVNISSLQMYRGLLGDMEETLQEWRDELQEDNDRLQDMTDQMVGFVRDSFPEKVAADSDFANLHLDEMLILKQRWKEAKSATTNNLDRINKLQATVSADYFDVTELENRVGTLLAGSGKKAFQPEYDYIWHASNASFDEVKVLTAQSISDRLTVLRYYLIINTQDWLYFLLAGIVFFFWVFRNFRRIKNKSATDYPTGAMTLKYLSPFPFLAALIFILALESYYSFDQPAIFIEVVQLCILIPLTIQFWKIWPRRTLLYWCTLALLYVSTSCINAVVTPGWPVRFSLLAINFVSVGFGFLLIWKDKNLVSGRLVRVSAFLYVILNFFALIANITGRLTLAKIFTSAAVIGLVQIIGLMVFIQILIEAFYLQMLSSRVSGGMKAEFDFENIRAGLAQVLTVIAAILGIIIFVTNIDMRFVAAKILSHIFDTPRKIGSTSFTLGNIVNFGLILYAASELQKYLGYFFGETDEEFVGDLDKKESRLVIFRLLIIVVGFFMAVIASGLPVDKVTVVLGALGVGIGLGLQNIVFNLVSGVILIFEKPMQIGDFIEVDDKKGRVQNIGIRSSKLVTPDGSEVIVPNGDILSSHMVNWTRSNNHRRAELVFRISPTTQLELAKDTITEELKANSFVIQDQPVDILVNNFSENSATLTVNVWINSIYKEQEFKSEVISGIYSKLAAKGIKIV